MNCNQLIFSIAVNISEDSPASPNAVDVGVSLLVQSHRHNPQRMFQSWSLLEHFKASTLCGMQRFEQFSKARLIFKVKVDVLEATEPKRDSAFLINNRDHGLLLVQSECHLVHNVLRFN